MSAGLYNQAPIWCNSDRFWVHSRPITISLFHCQKFGRVKKWANRTTKKTDIIFLLLGFICCECQHTHAHTHTTKNNNKEKQHTQRTSIHVHTPFIWHGVEMFPYVHRIWIVPFIYSVLCPLFCLHRERLIRFWKCVFPQFQREPFIVYFAYIGTT